MSESIYEIYETLVSGIDGDAVIEDWCLGRIWAAVKAGGHTGIAMMTPGSSVKRTFPEDIRGLTLKEAAKGILSWNMEEASLAMAAINCFYNTPERMLSTGCSEPFENYCTRGLEYEGRRIGVVGHMRLTGDMREKASEVITLERDPKEGDLPDPACEFVLPSCDIAVISGSTFINKTLPRLLALTENAETILIGPSVPMCPELIGKGVDRLSGLCITDAETAFEHVSSGRGGNPYVLGGSFLLM